MSCSGGRENLSFKHGDVKNLLHYKLYTHYSSENHVFVKANGWGCCCLVSLRSQCTLQIHPTKPRAPQFAYKIGTKGLSRLPSSDYTLQHTASNNFTLWIVERTAASLGSLLTAVYGKTRYRLLSPINQVIQTSGSVQRGCRRAGGPAISTSQLFG